jgi:two-component system, NarL family, invasion response regulator UvrY
MIKVFIADDHYIVRRGLKQILSTEEDICVTGEASNSEETIQNIGKTEWDILILDIALPGKNGLDTLINIKNKNPGAKVLVLSMYKEEEIVLRAFRTGANGYLNKDSAPEELITAIRQIIRGKKFIGTTMNLEFDSFYNNGESLYRQLSERELQVFCLLASGNSLKDIANDLAINIKTVSTYRSRILDKFSFRSNIDLVHYALKHKLVPPL